MLTKSQTIWMSSEHFFMTTALIYTRRKWFTSEEKAIPVALSDILGVPL